MKPAPRFLTKFRLSESAATAVEYAMVAGLISVLIITGATAIGSTLNARF